MFKLMGRILGVAFAALLGLGASLFVLATLGLERISQSAHAAAGDDDVDRVLEFMRLSLSVGKSLLALPTALIPALLVVIIGEVVRIRSALFYVGGAGASFALAALIAARDGTGSLPWAWPVLATAGFAGGLVYWLLAGRRA